MSSHKIHPETAIETVRAMIAGLSGIDGAEVVILFKKSLSIEAREANIRACQINEYAGAGIRLQSGKRVAQSFATYLEVKALKECLEKCKSLLPDAPEDPYTDISPMTYDGEHTYGSDSDRSFEKIPVEEKCNRLVNLEKKVLAADPRIKKAMGVTYVERQVREWVWTKGSKRALHYESTHARLSAAAIAQEKNEQQFYRAYDIQNSYFDLDWSQVAQNASQNAVQLLGGRPLVTGHYPVLFSSDVMIDLLDKFSHAFRGSRIVSGASCLEGYEGKKISSDQLRIIDDPFMKRQTGTRLWDSEGTPVNRAFIVDNGTLANFFWSKRSAKIAHRHSTGNAYRISERHLPEDGYHNLYIEPGTKDLIDLIRDTHKGFWIKRLLGLPIFDPYTGRLQVIASGQWIDQGHVESAIHGVSVVITLREFLSQVAGIGRDLKWSFRIGSPSLLVDKVFLHG